MRQSVLRKRKVQYHVDLVSYTDILGFGSLINKRTAGQISRILRVFKETVYPKVYRTSPPDVPTEQFANFSDLSVISTPLRNPLIPPIGVVFWQLMRLIHAQMYLIHNEGIFIRGAVTVGQVARSYGLLFGPALVDAYYLESEKAIYPRIILDQKVLEEIAWNKRLWTHDRDDELKAVKSLLRNDKKDGRMYLDYLRVAREEIGPEAYADFVERHRQRIDEALTEHGRNPKVRGKYLWLKRYHATTMKSLREGA